MKLADPSAVREATGEGQALCGHQQACRPTRSNIEVRRFGLTAGWIGLLVPFVAELVAIVRANHLSLIQRVPDDAFYYVEIAARVGRGDGFTFDGMHTTNGFHPLWQLLLVPIVRGFGAGTDDSVRAALVLALGCSLGAVLLFVRLVWRVAGAGPALLGGIVATQLGMGQWINGMEGAAVLLVLALLATALAVADRDRDAAGAIAVGCASALLVLSRLDFLPLLLVVGVGLAFRWRSARLLSRWAVGVAVVGVPSAVWWLASWGHALSTSATVKNATLSRAYEARFGGRLTTGYVDYVADVAGDYLRRLAPWTFLSDESLAVRHFGLPKGVAALCGLALLALAVLGWGVLLRGLIVRSRRGDAHVLGPEAWALVVVAVVVVLKGVFDLVNAPLWASAWYSAPQRLCAGFAVGAGAWLGIRFLARGARGFAVLAVAAVAVLLLPVNGLVWDTPLPTRHGASWQEQIDVAADWIAAQGPRGRYGARDAGLLGHRLDGIVPVVNLDGLVNDYAFARLVADNAPLVDRIRATGVEYFVGRLDDQRFAELARCGTEIWRSPLEVPYYDSLGGYSEAPVRVVDVGACLS